MHSENPELYQPIKLARAFELITDNKYVYTVDVTPDIHEWILNEQPVCLWRYSDDRSRPQYFGRTRIDVLKNLYIGLVLRYS